MALSGSLSNAFKTGYRIQIDWSATQNVGANTSTITASFYLISTSSSYSINASAAKALSIVIDGSTYSYSVNVTVAGNQTKLLAQVSHTIAHNADGSRSFAISGSLGIAVTLSGTYYGTVSIGAVGFALDTIPRSSYPTVSAANVTMGTAVAIYTNRASAAFTHNLYYNIGGNTAYFATGVADSYTWTPPTTLATLLPNSASGVCYVVCDTYNGGTYIGSQTTAFTIFVPSTMVPTISDVALAEAVAGIFTKFAGYVQYASKVTATITAAGASGSTISAYSTSILGLTYPGATFTSGFLTSSGTLSIVTTVTDSRGRQASLTKTISVIEYANPYITNFAIRRCLASGVPNEDGTSLHADMKFTIASVNSKNDKTWKTEYRVSGSSAWIALNMGNVYTYDAVYTNLTGLFGIDNAYEIKLTLTDFFGSVSTIVNLATAFTLLDFSASGKGFAIGQVSTADRFEVGMPTVFKDKAYLSDADRVSNRALDRLIKSLESGWVILDEKYSLSYVTKTVHTASYISTTLYDVQSKDSTSGVPMDLSSIISVGMKLKVIQGSVTTYFFIVKIVGSIITLYGGVISSLLNAAISDICYSTTYAPHGFPTTLTKTRTVLISRQTNQLGEQEVVIGFRPTFLKADASINALAYYTSTGSSDGQVNTCIFVIPNDASYPDGGNLIALHTGGSVFAADVTFTDIGFKLIWSSIGTIPDGNAFITFQVG